MRQLHLPAGSTARGRDPVVVTPEVAGWDHAGLEVLVLDGEPRDLVTDGVELGVLPLSGCLAVEVEHHRFEVSGRPSVWDHVTDWVLVPAGSEVRLTSDRPAEVALVMARTTGDRRPDPTHIPAGDVPVAVRGAGQATRTLVNFCSPDAVDCDSLMAVEVYTPAGNWSSYPPHKHDGRSGGPEDCDEAVLEEIYHFRIRGEDGFGFHRTYAADGAFDETVTVLDGDTFLVPHGYHGPCVATPGHDMYYLNVLAGPDDNRSMAFCTDPRHSWIWEAWEDVAPDPRCPMVGPPS